MFDVDIEHGGGAGISRTVFSEKGFKCQSIRSEKTLHFLSSDWMKFKSLPRKYLRYSVYHSLQLINEPWGDPS